MGRSALVVGPVLRLLVTALVATNNGHTVNCPLFELEPAVAVSPTAGFPNSFALSNDESLLAFSTDNNYVVTFVVTETNLENQTLYPLPGALPTQVRPGKPSFSGDGSLLAVPNRDSNTIDVFRVVNNMLLHVESVYSAEPLSIEFTSDIDCPILIVTELSPLAVAVFEVDNDTLTDRIPYPYPWVSAGMLCITPDDGLAITTTGWRGNSVVVYRISPNGTLHGAIEYPGPPQTAGYLQGVVGCDVSPNGQYLVTAHGEHDSVTLWRIVNGTLVLLDNFPMNVYGTVWTGEVFFTPDNEYVIRLNTGRNPDTIAIAKVTEDQLQHWTIYFPATSVNFWGRAISADGTRLFLGDHNRALIGYPISLDGLGINGKYCPECYLDTIYDDIRHSCLPCDAGHVPNGNQTACIQCPFNQVVYTENNPPKVTTCIPCPSGHFPAGNQTKCLPCPAGQVINITAAECRPCPVDTIAFNGSSCMPCPAGELPQENQTICLPCPPGQVVNSSSIECRPCPVDTIAFNGSSCMLCPAGEIPQGNQTICQPCPAGQVVNSSITECQACSGDSIAVNGTSCLSCPSGEHPNPAQADCIVESDQSNEDSGSDDTHGSSDEDKTGGSNNTPAILGGVFGGLAVIVACCLLLVLAATCLTTLGLIMLVTLGTKGRDGAVRWTISNIHSSTARPHLADIPVMEFEPHAL